MRYTWIPATMMLAAILLAGCVEKISTTDPTVVTSGGSAGSFNPNKIPRLLNCSPNAGPELSSTEFYIEAQNLLPNEPVDIQFGNLQFTGLSNQNGSRIVNPAVSTGTFTAPPGTGSKDLVVFISGQNPPQLELANAFTYLPPGTPNLPTADTMTPRTADENGGTIMTLTGTNVPQSFNYRIVCSFLFGTGAVNVVGLQTGDDLWEVTVPAVPATENFTTGDLEVTVTVTFSDTNQPQQLPIPITSAPPPNTTDGNPLVYTHSGTPLSPIPEEFVILSGAYEQGATGAIRGPESYVRTIKKWDVEAETLETVPDLDLRYMYNGSTLFAPAGTHSYPSPLMNNGASFRDASSIFAHFALPSFDRTYLPAVAVGVPQPPPVTKPVTATLYHQTGPESGSSGPPSTGLQDGFFAVYSNGECEVFDTGAQPIHEEIHIHERFGEFPFFAVVHDSSTPRIFIARMDGEAWVGSGNNTSELNLSNVNGDIRHLSLKFSGAFLYFATSTGHVYRCPVDTTQQGIAPEAVAMNWPAGAVHDYVSDEFALSGNGNTIVFAAGDGNVRWDNLTQTTPPSLHDIFAIQDANLGNTNITAVTDFDAAGGGKQIVTWNVGSNATYGTANVSNGANDRRVYMAGVNAFSNQTNLAGADVVVSFDGQLCAFVTREDRDVVEGTVPAFVVYYLYVARIGQGVNNVQRINSATGNAFGIGNVFDRDMTVIPGMYFPKTVPNNGMRNRLLFTVASVSGGGVAGENAHLFTADITFTATGLATPVIRNRSEPGFSPPFAITPADPSYNYFGGFPSRGGHVYFLIDATTADFLYVDIRDGVTTSVQPVVRSHDGQPMKLPARGSSSNELQNTYLPPGFAPDPAGAVNLEHWANQLRSLQGPNLNQFTAEYLMLVAEEAADAEDLYVLQMTSLARPLPSPAVNISNISGAGVIKAVAPSPDGSVIALVKGTAGFAHGYRFTPAAGGKLHIINDLTQALRDNEAVLRGSATPVNTTGNRISRAMAWYRNADRYTLYFGEGSTATGGAPSTVKAFLRLHRLDLDRSAGNSIGTPQHIDQIDPAGNQLVEGAFHIYGVGKQE